MKDNLQVLLRGAVTTGMSAYFDTATPPEGWFERAGTVLLRAEFPEIWAYALANNLVIANSLWTGTNVTKFSDGDGSTTFRLPDNRGDFVRNWDNGRGVDTGRTLGSYQGDAIRNITGSIGYVYLTSSSGGLGALRVTPWGSSPAKVGVEGSDPGANYTVSMDASLAVPTAADNRPRNTALLFCIKY